MPEPGSSLGGREAHWDAVYRDRGPRGVSWYQPTPTVSVELIRRVGVATNAAIFDVGGGTSRLAETLLAEGFTDLTVLDISGAALEALRQRLGTDSPVTLLHDDVLAQSPLRPVDLWHDRAVYHFLVDDRDRQTYIDRLRRTLREGGHVIVGAFAPDGPQSCSGLPAARYSPEALGESLGTDFEVVEHRREEHVTPGGVVQPFTWIAARLRG